MILVTTFTGSILTAAWLITSYLLDKTGHLIISYTLGKVVTVMWVLPAAYFIIELVERLKFTWKGRAFDVSPLILSITHIIVAVWVVAALIGIVIYACKRLRLFAVRKEAFPCDKDTAEFFDEVKKNMGLERYNITLRQSYRTTTAYVTGLVRPCVVINAQKFTEKEMQVIFTHELMHVIHKDIWFRYLLALGSIFNFFNPLIWIFSRRFIKYAEFACDYSICSYENGMQEYYETIFNMAIKNNNLYDMLSASLYENKSSLRERMEHVMKSYNVKKKSKVVAALIVALFVMVSSSMVTGAATLVAGTSVKVAEVTSDENEETTAFDTEYYEAPGEGDADVIEEYDGRADSDGIDLYASSGRFSWKIYAGVRRSTSAFHASSGQRIVLSVFSVSPFHTVRAGIVQPDGSKRYILVNSASHIFDLTMSGTYIVYIQNDTTETLQVEGAYETY